jgi:hypothetical protein
MHWKGHVQSFPVAARPFQLATCQPDPLCSCWMQSSIFSAESLGKSSMWQN